MKNKLFITLICTLFSVLFASCNGGGSSVTPASTPNPAPKPTITPSPEPYATAQYVYLANTGDVLNNIQYIYVCEINVDGVFNGCKSQLSRYAVTSLTANTATIYIPYYFSSYSISSYLTESDGGIIDVSSMVNNSTSMVSISYISAYKNYFYITKSNIYYGQDIKYCSLTGTNLQTLSACYSFSSPNIDLSTVSSISNVAINPNGYAYFITSKQTIAQCVVNTQKNGSLTNCSTNNSLSAIGALNTLTVTNNYAYIFNVTETSIYVCPITANGTLGATCQKQLALNSMGQNMMGATVISPIVRNNRLFFVNSKPDISTNSAVVSCPIIANGLLGTCTTSAASSEFSVPQAMTMI